jgi:hypothetical protein
MNARKESTPSTLARIKKTTKPSGAGKKTEVFDFYNTLDETARLTADATPNLHSPSSEEIPNLHQPQSQDTPPQDAPPTSQKEKKNESTSSPLRRTYLQSNRLNSSRYRTFKYQHRPDPSSPSKQEHSEPPSQQPTPFNQPKTQEENPIPMNATLHTPTSHNPHTTDFRDNVRRQASEQKSIGRILTLISISFATLIIASFALAGYGGYVMWNRLNEQSSTLVDVENKFNSRISTLQSSIDRLQIELHRTQKYSDELTRQNQELTRALREQQEMARRTKAQVDTLVNQIRQEKILRDQQFASLSRDLNRNSAPRALPSVPNTQAARQADRFPSSTPLSPVRR